MIVRMNVLRSRRAPCPAARARDSRSPRSRSCSSTCRRRPGSCRRRNARDGGRREAPAPPARSGRRRRGRAGRARRWRSAAASFTAASASISAGNSRSGDAGDRKILERAQRLHAVQRVVRHVALAEQVVLGARARAGEAERAAVADERRVGRGEPLRDRARGACRRAPRTASDASRISSSTCAAVSMNASVRRRSRGARAVRRVVEQQSLADRFAGAERDEADRTASWRFLDRDRAGRR